MADYVYIAVRTATGMYNGSGESFSLLKARKDKDQLVNELSQEFGEPRILMGQPEWRNNNGTTIETIVIKEMINK